MLLEKMIKNDKKMIHKNAAGKKIDKKKIKKIDKFWAASETIKNGECLEIFSFSYRFFYQFFSFSKETEENE